MEYLLSPKVQLRNCFGNTIESLIRDLSSYESKISLSEIKGSEVFSSSYFKGAKFVMDNLLELYNKVNSSMMGFAKIYALNCTVNKQILGSFLKEFKQELGITEIISRGEALDIPMTKRIIDRLAKNYENADSISSEAFILGAKSVAKIIEYAYYAPLTKPFQGYIASESKNIVNNISKKLNSLA